MRGDEIVVITADFRAVYCKAKDRPQLVMRGRTATEDYELLARVWQAQTTRRASWGGLFKGRADRSRRQKKKPRRVSSAPGRGF